LFKKILIANRGEIALRIIRACKELGILSVAVYSEKDAESLHVKFADEAVCIGAASPMESYLNIPRVISAAEITNAEAIHPGYGFLAENAGFAEICESCGIKFIGPPAEVIRKMGDKSFAKETMVKSNVPVIPGNNKILENHSEAEKLADEIGYPVILKATAGGGGRGMKIIRDKSEIKKKFDIARSEAEAAFGNPGLYIEKYIENPRHIEVQILGDTYGNVIHIGERECSIQRRYQKLIEETPSPIIDSKLRKEIGDAAVRAAKGASYCNAGTVEFLLDENRNFYFMEVNTRIQVEHPITEVVSGIDLIKQQLKIAAGEKLNLQQKNIQLRGHAIECRINAEDPENGFMPSPGKIKGLHLPGGFGVRIDTHIYSQYEIPPYYDSLVAKVITFGIDRAESIERMRRVLDEMVIEGIKTTVPFHKKVISNSNFKKGLYNTSFLEKEF